MQMNDKSVSPSFGPSWMLWIAIGSIILSLTVVLLMDMNGNIVFSERSIPDILRPAPLLLTLLALASSVTIPVIHLVRYPGRRRLWAILLLLSLVLAACILLPAL